MAAIMPAMVIIGLAKTKPILYAGLTLFSFGKLTSGLLFRLETKECGKYARSNLGGHAK